MATSLEKGVQFQSMLHELSKNEFIRLMGKIFDEYQANLIGSSLFIHLSRISPNTCQQNMHDLEFLNCTISAIIRSRERSNINQFEGLVVKLGQFSKGIFGHIASWLPQSDYFHFEQANRSIFNGCNSPNMLVELNLMDPCSVLPRRTINYSSIKLQKYVSLKHLKRWKLCFE